MSVEEFARRVGVTAVLALEREAAIAPKPGLVDRLGPGAHTDMNYATFVRSSTALGPYFRDACLLGATAGVPAGQLLALLRERGVRAEAEMYAATGGVNTHKGAIFSLGIVCAATGLLYAWGKPPEAGDVLAAAGEIAAPCLADFTAQGAAQTAGHAAYAAHGLAGVRGEAAAGFPHVRNTGLPVLTALLTDGYNWDIAGVNALLRLMVAVPDTNLVKRGGLAAAQTLQARLATELEGLAPEDALAYAQALDDELTTRMLSPGGSADLLAVSCFLWLLAHLE